MDDKRRPTGTKTRITTRRFEPRTSAECTQLGNSRRSPSDRQVSGSRAGQMRSMLAASGQVEGNREFAFYRLEWRYVWRDHSSRRCLNAAEFPMSEDGPWLNVPQAVVLEATRDINLALDLTEDDPVLLVIKANQRIALRTVIPLEEDADDEQRRDAVRRLREERAALHGGDRYQEAQQRLHRRLL